MNVVVTADYQALSRYSADLVQDLVKKNPRGLVSFPGGDTPAGLLDLFTARVRSGKIDISELKFVQLDDWVGLGQTEKGSCSHFILTRLLAPMGCTFADRFLFDGNGPDINGQLAAQDAFIRKYGPIDIEVLGIGMNGHLGFNEEGVDFSLRSHRTPLSSTTKRVQKKYFGGQDLPLTEGITQGIAQIMESRTVILLASGESKAEIVAKALLGPVTRSVPASVLQRHQNCICVLDRAAASLLPENLSRVSLV